MKFFGKTFGLLLASLTLASCGGGGGDGHGAFTPAQSGTITLTATTTTLPLNTQGYLPSQHGPTQAEVNISLRNADGSLMAGHDVSVSISPVNIAAISVLNDGTATTDDLYGTYVIKGTNGQATAFVNSRLIAGTAVFTASAEDPNTRRTISATLTFTTTSGVGTAPASIALVPAPAGVYLPSSGGGSTSSITATVRDGGGQFVPNPPAGADNVQYEIVGTPGDARLSTNSASGAASGTSVTTHTVQGLATASFQAGEATPQGPIQIRATVDRADNNVSNGIQDPLSSTASIIVSDGKLYSLQLTSSLAAPNLPGITINCITDPCLAVSGDTTANPNAIPPNPDATLSLAITAKAQDRQGNPVIRGTPIRFGSVDEPVGAPGTAQDNQFLLSGVDGNPAESGSNFSAPTGHFTTAGAGAGPGDALVVFGKAVQGNADLESAVTVQSVNSATSLTATPNFNRNDTTGVLVDYGPVLPYLIGRSLHGSITTATTTDADLLPTSPPRGIAHASLTYTVSTVGNSVAIWAQGDGIDRVTNGPNRVTDAGTLVYPGVAPISITALPDPVPGNKPTTVTVCVTDSLGIRLRGVTLGFNFTLPSGSGKVDGVSGSGAVGHPTGIDGCVQAAVTTTGLPLTATGSNADSGTLTFNAGGKSATVHFVVQLAFISNAGVGSVCSSGTPTAVVNIKAFTTGGDPAAGVSITAACTGVTVTPGTSITGSNGSAQFSLTGAVGATGTCTFTATGVAPITVPVKIPAAADFSPPC